MGEQLFGQHGVWHLSARKTAPYHAWCGREWTKGKDNGFRGVAADTTCIDCLKMMKRGTPVTPERWRR